MFFSIIFLLAGSLFFVSGLAGYVSAIDVFLHFGFLFSSFLFLPPQLEMSA